ncbi:hypothetical protein Purlil1_12994 [Purpureocillium lilacinum]|uniref:Uncharacterized protein n=1 Tax=Purpureocillium lilacinum TaxID=33203 RepID=A0ABR0BFB6_PURLI|nr:hypothetical protein Purlil1_12994 [Purpureocillium lilacinum]
MTKLDFYTIMPEFDMTVFCSPEDLESTGRYLYNELEKEGLDMEYDKPVFAVFLRFTFKEVQKGLPIPRGCAVLNDQLNLRGFKLEGNPYEDKGHVFVKRQGAKQRPTSAGEAASRG